MSPDDLISARQAGPESGPGLQLKVPGTFQVVSFSLGSGGLGECAVDG